MFNKSVIPVVLACVFQVAAVVFVSAVVPNAAFAVENPFSLKCSAEYARMVPGDHSGDYTRETVKVAGSEKLQFIFNGPVQLEHFDSLITYQIGFNWQSELILNLSDKKTGASARTISPFKPELGNRAFLSVAVAEMSTLELTCEVVKTPPPPPTNDDEWDR